MSLTKVQRIQKGLDRDGLVVAWNDLSTHTDYVRGLILTEAKHDWESKKNNGEWSDYLAVFLVDGKSITRGYVSRLINATAEKAEPEMLRADNSTDSLKETEAELTLPDSASTQMELRGENAVQKARNYNEVKEVTGKDQPSAGDIRAFNNARKEAKVKHDEFKKKAKIPKLEKPDPFTTEEEIDFETWCIREHNFDILAEKPKGTRAIYALKDENVSKLFHSLSKWKKTYRVMAKLCHPDTGGSKDAMIYLSGFNELMKSLEKIKVIVDYEEKVEKYRVEYSQPKRI